MKKLTIFKFQLVMCKMLSIIFLSVCIIFSICVYHSFADVPCKINYQGRLIKDNVPVNIPVDMVFELYESVDATTPIWDETHNNVPVHNGLFRVVLNLESVTWVAGQELWLEVTIVDGVERDTLSPREQIYAYPYAINTHLLEGSTKEYFLNVSGEEQTKYGPLNIMGDVGIGTTSPQAKLHVGGTPGTDGIMFPDGTLQTSAIRKYESPWFPVSGGTTYTRPHELGVVPDIVQVWYSNTSDGSGHVVLVGSANYGGTHSIIVVDVDSTYITIRGQSHLAHYYDAGGVDRHPTSGFAKIVALKIQ